MSEVMSEDAAQNALFSAMQNDGLAPTSYGTEGEGSAPGSTEAEAALAAQRAASQSEQQQGTPQGTETEQQTETPAEPTAEETATEAFTRLDPNTIPDDLKPWYHSMQADYTRKTQQVADLRKQYEGVDVDQLQQAKTFYDSLHDPQFAKTFYEQLGSTLTNLGYLEAQKAQELESVATAATSYSDPEEFFAAKAAELDAKYEALNQQFEAQRVAAEQERIYTALASEVQRQESILRDANPHYTDTDVEAIYAMAGNDTNLLEAADRYEAAVADRINRMMAAKTSVASTVGVIPAVGSASEPTKIESLEQGHRMAQERLAQILAAEQ